MLVKLCHHWKEDGVMCRAVALRGRLYCHFHQEARRHQARRLRYQRRRQP